MSGKYKCDIISLSKPVVKKVAIVIPILQKMKQELRNVKARFCAGKIQVWTSGLAIASVGRHHYRNQHRFLKSILRVALEGIVHLQGKAPQQHNHAFLFLLPEGDRLLNDSLLNND